MPLDLAGLTVGLDHNSDLVVLVGKMIGELMPIFKNVETVWAHICLARITGEVL